MLATQTWTYLDGARISKEIRRVMMIADMSAPQLSRRVIKVSLSDLRVQLRYGSFYHEVKGGALQLIL